MPLDNEIVYKYGELFCGPGGMAKGASQVRVKSKKGTLHRIEHVWAVDNDINACNTFLRNICPENPESIICADVRDINLSELESVDIMSFGFPCNDFSTVGEKQGLNGSYGLLYKQAAKALRTLKPLIFVAENVHGLKLISNGDGLSAVLADFSSAGYDLYPHLYHFEDYGVPQSRHRIIIVGVRNDLKFTFQIPSPTHAEHVSCRFALENKPIKTDAWNNELTKQSEQVVNRLKHIKPGENAWNANIPEHLKLHVKGAWISQIYRRLHPDKPSYTITGSGGGGTHVYHWREPRALTNRERARLQTFPDSYVFEGSKESVRKQIGMAVPPRASRVIFRAILNTLAGIQYQSVASNIDTNHLPRKKWNQ